MYISILVILLFGSSLTAGEDDIKIPQLVLDIDKETM